MSARSARVEQVVDVPAGQMVEVSQYPGDTVETVELRKNVFERCTDGDECQAAFNELTTLMLAQFGQVSLMIQARWSAFSFSWKFLAVRGGGLLPQTLAR